MIMVDILILINLIMTLAKPRKDIVYIGRHALTITVG